MPERLIPVIGSQGFFDLQAPFNAQLVEGLEYTSRAVRALSDYIANNEDPWETIYNPNGIQESVYKEDLKQNAYVVSLQSSTGHWLYVPERYVLHYPSVNGVPYRSVMIGVSLPSMPVEQDFGYLLTDVKSLVDSALGVSSTVRTVETSKVVLIPRETHDIKRQERLQNSINHRTMHDRIVDLTTKNTAMTTKIRQLEDYILQLETQINNQP